MSGRRIAISLALAALGSTGATAHSPYLVPHEAGGDQAAASTLDVGE